MSLTDNYAMYWPKGGGLRRLVFRVGKTLYELFPPESITATVPFYQKAFAGEECEFEFSWSGYIYKMHVAPLEEEDGNVTLIIALAQDITERKRAEEERRQAETRNRFLVRLDDAIRPLDDPAEITLTAARILGQHLGVDRCAYADIEADEDTMNLAGNYLRGPHIKSIIMRLRFVDFGAEVLQLMREDKPCVVNDVDTHAPPVGDLAAYRATQIQAVICVPLHKGGRVVGAMAVHSATTRVWQTEEIKLVRVVAARCWESIERA